MNVFTIQEHLIFALSGSTVAVAFLSFVTAIAFYVGFPFGRFSIMEAWTYSWQLVLKLLGIYAVVILIDLVALALFAWFILKPHFDQGGPIAGLVFSVTGLCYALSALSVRNYSRIKDKVAALSFVVLSVSASLFMSGTFYGTDLLTRAEFMTNRAAIMESGERVGLVRFGQQFSIVRSADGRVHAVETSKLADAVHIPSWLGVH